MTGAATTALLSPHMTPIPAKYIIDNFTAVNQVGSLDSSFVDIAWIDKAGELYVINGGAGNDYLKWEHGGYTFTDSDGQGWIIRRRNVFAFRLPGRIENSFQCGRF